MSISLADELTSAGDRYWRIIDPVESKSLTPPFWSGEIDWLVGSLERIAVSLDPSEYPDHGQAFPIEFIFRGIDAVVILFDHKDHRPRLRFERWKGTWVNQEKDTTQVRRYFGPNGRSSFGQLVLNKEWTSQLQNLTAQFRQTALDDRNRYWIEYHDRQNQISATPPPADHVIVRAQRAGQEIGLPWTPLFGPFVDATVLDRPLLHYILESCGGGTANDAISANLDRQLDARRIGQMLTWSTRYDDTTISGAYFFRVDVGADKRALYSATRDAEGFAADPLLSALSEIAVNLSPANDGAPASPTPQFPKGLPLDTLRQRASISGLVTTPWGALPRPSSKRASATVRAAGLQPTMNRFRWWMLQLLDLAAGALVNLPPKDPVQMLRALQRVALLEADCRAAFASVDDSEKKIEKIRQTAIQHYNAALQGQTDRASIRRKADLP